MEIERIPVAELADDLAAEWDALRPAQSTVSSPFYSSGYARMVAAERPNVEAGVVRVHGRLKAVMAYERSGRSAIPAGGGITDFQGPVTAAIASTGGRPAGSGRVSDRRTHAERLAARLAAPSVAVPLCAADLEAASAVPVLPYERPLC